jgi:hypothetical protein
MSTRHTESSTSKNQQMLDAFAQEVGRTIAMQKAGNGVSRLAIVRTYFAPITRMIEAGVTIETIAKAIPENLIDHKMLQSYLSRERREMAKQGQAKESTPPVIAPEIIKAGDAESVKATSPEAAQEPTAEHNKAGDETMTEANQSGEIHQMVSDAHQMLDDLHKRIDSMAVRMSIIDSLKLDESDERITALRKLIATGMLAPTYVDAINGLIEHVTQ